MNGTNAGTPPAVAGSVRLWRAVASFCNCGILSHLLETPVRRSPVGLVPPTHSCPRSPRRKGAAGRLGAPRQDSWSDRVVMARRSECS